MVSRQKAANVLENGRIHDFFATFGVNVGGKSPETIVKGRTLSMKQFYQNIHNTAQRVRSLEQLILTQL